MAGPNGGLDGLASATPGTEAARIATTKTTEKRDFSILRSGTFREIGTGTLTIEGPLLLRSASTAGT